MILDQPGVAPVRLILNPSTFNWIKTNENDSGPYLQWRRYKYVSKIELNELQVSELGIYCSMLKWCLKPYSNAAIPFVKEDLHDIDFMKKKKSVKEWVVN